MVHKEIFMHPT